MGNVAGTVTSTVAMFMLLRHSTLGVLSLKLFKALGLIVLKIHL